MPSIERARVFLWLCYYYLESPGSPNPFADNANTASSESDATRAPSMRKRTPEEMTALPAENVDPQDEVEHAQKLAEQRRTFLLKEKASVAAAREEGGASERSKETTPAPAITTTVTVGTTAPITAPPANKVSRGGKKNNSSLILEPPAPRGNYDLLFPYTITNTPYPFFLPNVFFLLFLS